MPSPAFLFGSIGSVAETSDIRRRAYNRALSEAGLGWSWDRETHARLLGRSGGRDRLSLLARVTGTPGVEAGGSAVSSQVAAT